MYRDLVGVGLPAAANGVPWGHPPRARWKVRPQAPLAQDVLWWLQAKADAVHPQPEYARRKDTGRAWQRTTRSVLTTPSRFQAEGSVAESARVLIA